MTDADLSQFGVGTPDREETPEPDTSEDYKFTRPQCRALTADGDRCSNPTVRGRDTQFCPAHDDMEDVATIDDSDDDPADPLGVECDADGCETRVVGLDDGWEYERGTVCQNCIDYNRRHGHWPDEERDPCVECKIDEGYVRHECDECQFDAVILDPPATCEYCGAEVDDAE